MTSVRCEYVCPACRAPVAEAGPNYHCVACGRQYPILFGIPDFRLEGDQYLTLEEERAKAANLHAFAQVHDFAALVAYYYAITDDVPGHLKPVFAEYVLNAEARSRGAFRALAPDGGGRLLDLGCGSGGALAAARTSFQQLTGVDIALRWLVIADKRLRDMQIPARLVCADADCLPFTGESFTHVLATDLLENTVKPYEVIEGAASLLEKGGRFYISSSNGNWLGPHPATGLWAAGLLPKRVRAAILRGKYGVDLLRAVTFIRPSTVSSAAQRAGLKQIEARAIDLPEGWCRNKPPLIRLMATAYSAFARMPVLGTALLHAGPVFQAIFLKERTA